VRTAAVAASVPAVQPADIARLTSVADPAVSPDGRRVAFTATRVDLPANRYRSAVWLAEADGSRPPFPLTSGEHSDSAPRWSPDGTRLAFTRTVEGRGSLHVLPVDGPGEAVRVCERPEAVGDPAWSPDGTRLAFTSRERTGRWADGDDERSRPPRRIDRLFARLDDVGWTVDRPTSVFVVPADGSADPVLVAGGPYEHGAPAWSPGGERLVVAANRRPGGDLDQRADLHLVDPAGRDEPRALTGGPLSYSAPACGPDGRIACLAVDAAVVPSHHRLVLLDEDGTERVLTAGLDRRCEPFPGARAPVWTDAGLLFSIEDHGDVPLLRVPAVGGGEPEVLVGGTRAVRGYDAAGGLLAFVAATPSAQPELFVRDADGTERRLTRLGDAFHAAVPPRAAEPLEVVSPHDGARIDAWVVRPGGDGPHPVLLSVHGGPMAQYGPAWMDEFQMWAGAGYAVVFANPHGSTGHTEAFAREIRSPQAPEHPGTGWGEVPAADVLAALDAALARHPDLDGGRVGVLGGSYGGYLTTWLVAHTDRFAAACSERAANNLLSLEWGGSDAAGLFHQEVGVSHLDAPQVYREQTPLERVRDIRTPVLVLHSDDDLRCPPEQADQLFVALRLLGREVEYWRFPAEGHELSRSGSPRHRVQRAEIVLDWFGRHLGGRRPTITWDHPSRA
jgi:dipeptidyl aminopeptidase/acylaminoacyl peptidase